MASRPPDANFKGDSQRPKNIRTETWAKFSDKQREKAKREWALESARLDKERALSKWPTHIPEADAQSGKYNKMLEEVRASLSTAPAPAMPVTPLTLGPVPVLAAVEQGARGNP